MMQPTTSEAQGREEWAVVREVRLRAAFAHFYPSLDPDTWMPAAEASAKVLFYRLSIEGPSAVGRRLLEDEHFEFRGGWTRGMSRELRTRVTDPDAPARP